MKRFFVLILMLLSMVLVGCATVLSGNSEDIRIQSKPEEAEVIINNIPRGHTPLRLELEKSKSYTIEIKHPDYPPRYITLDKSVNTGWVILDVLCGFIPIIVDASTGAWYNFSDDFINVSFDSDPYVDEWKGELLKSAKNFEYKRKWKRYAQNHDLEMTFTEWINNLSMDEFKHYKKTDLQPKKWLWKKLKNEFI